MKEKKAKRIGILTAGGDCPGLNAAIRGVGKTAIVKYGMEVIGFSSGFSGLINKDYVKLEENQLSNILTLGGTILGSSREKPFKKTSNKISTIDKPKLIEKHYHELELDCLVCIGGNGTQKNAAKIAAQGLNVIGIPKTIDNDVWGTDVTFGFESALEIATEAIDRLHSTANSHNRIMVIEIMGHHAGWLALYAGMAGGGDIILIPEIEYNLNVVYKYLEHRVEQKKSYSIVVVAEGIKKPKTKSAARYISQKIRENTGLESRETILGYVQRGGSPNAMDRILATSYGSHAAELINNGAYGRMVCKNGEAIESIPLSVVGGKLRNVPPNHSLVVKARGLGICMGDSFLPKR